MANVIVDLPEVLERVQDDHELLIELFDIFQDDFTEKSETLVKLVESKDADKLRDIAHALKGAASNISAKIIFASFAELEQRAEDGQLDDLSSLLDQINDQYKDLESEIVKIKQDLK